MDIAQTALKHVLPTPPASYFEEYQTKSTQNLIQKLQMVSSLFATLSQNQHIFELPLLTAIMTTDTPTRIWERHVDDVFSILRRCNLEQHFQHINSLHPKTKITMEKEENSTIPFLDTFIQRNQDGTISVKVHRKPTHTNQYLSFTSHHSTRSKQSVITALFNRAENVITNNTELKQEQQHITKVLQSNGYSKQFIDKTRRQWHLKQQNKNNNQPAEKEPEPVRIINLPYFQGLCEQPQRTLSQHNIKSTFYTATTLGKILPSPKDPIPTEKKHNISYKLDCKDCDAVCIGESKRAYQTRIEEHISTVRKADTRRYETADHCSKFNHDFKWTKNNILGHELNTTRRKIKETIHSIKTEICINGISYKLLDIWLPAIKVKHDAKTQTENNCQIHQTESIRVRNSKSPPKTSLYIRIGPNSTHIYDFTRQNSCPKMREVSLETSPV